MIPSRRWVRSRGCRTTADGRVHVEGERQATPLLDPSPIATRGGSVQLTEAASVVPTGLSEDLQRRAGRWGLRTGRESHLDVAGPDLVGERL